jgi:D-alanyl-D-alanine carboxypeptidase
MVIDANTGAVLHNKSGDAACYPASLTKMMTLYMTFELIEQGRMSYATKIKMSETAAAAPPSKLKMKPGDQLTVLDAIKALVTKSANNVAVALAEHIGGSEENFARLMTKRARQLGMTSTVFKNASGLPNREQKTTARDMLKLAMHLQDHFPQHYKLFSIRHFTYRGRRYRNHNALLRRFRGTDGIKTGYTRASGFNLVANVRRDGKHVVAVVFGGKSARVRNAKMRSILTKALAKASRKKTRKPVLVARAKSPTPPRPVRASSKTSPRAPHLRGTAQPRAEPLRNTAAVASGPFQVQVGAYIASADAERQMAQTRRRSGGLLDRYRGVAVPVENGRRQLYRARFQGFERTAAYSTCASLKRLQIDCFVLRMQ